MNINSLLFTKTDLYHIKDYNFYLIDDNFIINPSKSDYIPYGFLSNKLYNVDYENRTLDFNKDIKLWAQKNFQNISSAIESRVHPYNINDIILYQPVSSQTYISSSLIIYKGEVVFSIAFDSDYLKNKLSQIFEESTDGSFYKLCKDHSLFNKNSVQDIFHYDVRNKMDLIDRDELIENSIIFMDTVFMDRYDKSNFIRHGLCSNNVDFREIRQVKDNTRGYFTSKILNKLEIPSFSDIDAPEKMSLEFIKEHYQNHQIQI